jgi:M6 family metalloprotease-like protein
MKRILLSILIVLGFVVPNFLQARKIPVSKITAPVRSEKKIHPIENYLSGTAERLDSFSRNSNKLLVLLIEFQEDNDPQSTGNGTFIQDPEGYPISLGTPPHDHEFFTTQLQALNYYYLAASFGSYDLESDIFPISSPGDFLAYTLPHEMAYYNPPGADTDLMISRFEEYFQDAFTIADADENIDFSQYDHFMFIHAGADWQHDIFGDTPADIPSFFIRVGTGKEVIVDDGIVIDHACNVPEMITQDIDDEQDGSITIYLNYGVVNAVFAHEFGHSLGFVDLYNTMYFTPQVGVFDIMDSGGNAGLLVVSDDNDNLYYFEGSMPILPGAWSRMLAWEDIFRTRGIFKDISELEFNETIELLPAEHLFDPPQATTEIPCFVKVPLSDTEYILIENRQVDPDGDSGIGVWASDDGRVILYPTYPAHLPGEDPTYEYDYFLPGWPMAEPTGEFYYDIGGGLLIWHIDEAILAENDNFENNTINIYHSHRAVKIIEADNIDDIGNVYSMFWEGTQYEPFFKFMPVIDEEGYFTGWDNETIININGDEEFIGTIFNEELSAVSAPALITNTSDPSIFSLYDISSYSIEPGVERIMSFKFGSHLFDGTEKIAQFDSLKAIGHVGTSLGFPTFTALKETELNFFSLLDEHWADNFGIVLPFDKMPAQPIFPVDLNLDGEDEYMIINETELYLTTTDGIQTHYFMSYFSEPPLFIEDISVSITPLHDGIHIDDIENSLSTTLDISDARIAFNGTFVVATNENGLYLIDPVNSNIESFINIPNSRNDFSPVCYKDAVNSAYNATFVQDNTGNIYKIKEGNTEKIFSLYPYTSAKPSQLALGHFLDDGQVYLVFGAEDRAFAITLNGTLAPGFPAYLDDRIIKPESYPRIIKFGEEIILLFEEADNGYIAVNKYAKISIQHSFSWRKTEVIDQFYWNEQSEKLYYIYSDADNNLFSSYIENVYEDPIIWNGYRNQNYSLYYGEISPYVSSTDKMTAYAFPNPAKKGEVRIKVVNAKDDIDIKVFDIAGNIVFKKKVEKGTGDDRDILWNTRKIATGVYFSIVRSKGEVKKVPIAIIN